MSKPILEQCRDDGASAAEAALAHSQSLHLGLNASLEDWVAGFSPEPTGEMTAAWLEGFSSTLAVRLKTA